MPLSFVNIFRKEEAEAESSAAQAVDSKESVEARQEEAQKKGKHGEDVCCGGCS
ncbi:CCGSCS motif protein [Marinobacter salicampi]|uniref:CCGSCS motif protein n=1 Tax=Marinobacter salicampi TaxID=435907 RepID=UPI00140A225A|nr:CCGSCS motif protein [Marinobacter salicampi]